MSVTQVAQLLPAFQIASARCAPQVWPIRSTEAKTAIAENSGAADPKMTARVEELSRQFPECFSPGRLALPSEHLSPEHVSSHVSSHVSGRDRCNVAASFFAATVRCTCAQDVVTRLGRGALASRYLQ